MPQKINIQKALYALRHKYATLNNVVIVVAFMIAAGWAWGSLDVMQRNYALQREVDFKRKQLTLTDLQKQSLELQSKYYESDEYKELAARESLGLVLPGEKMLILPENSERSKSDGAAKQQAAEPATATTSNLEQWLNFLFGGYSKSINKVDD